MNVSHGQVAGSVDAPHGAAGASHGQANAGALHGPSVDSENAQPYAPQHSADSLHGLANNSADAQSDPMHSSADGLASAPHDPSPTGASHTLPGASHGTADALHDPSVAPHGDSTNAPDNPSPPAALPDLSTAADHPSIPVGAQHSSIDAPRGSSTPVGLHYAPPLPSDTVNHTQHLVDTSLQPPACSTQQAHMDHYALARYSSVGKINDKSLD